MQKITPEMYQLILDRKSKGFTITSTAKLLGVVPSTIHRILKYGYTHKPLKPKSVPYAEKFKNRCEALVKPDGDCLIWTGRIEPSGYGRVCFRGEYWYAHRLSWYLNTWIYPKWSSDVIMHKCDNPPCVKFEHLTLGTQGLNIHDAMLKGRRPMREDNPLRALLSGPDTL